jgi:ADP-ribosylglycohydrolase
MENASRRELERLLAAGRVQVRNSPVLHRATDPLPPDFDFARVTGMMLGLAVGDALGNSTEGRFKDRGTFGDEIRDYLLHPRWGERKGYPSDDSQMAFWTLEQILADGRFMPERLIDIFATREIFGIGGTVNTALGKREAGVDWRNCGLASAGNGALMRIAPILIPHLRAPSPELWADTVLCTMLTHNDSMAIASSLAFVHVLWELLRRDDAPAPCWWSETFVSILKELECRDDYAGRSPALTGFRGPLWKLLEQELPFALKYRPKIHAASERWYSGAYLLETVPTALYILTQYADDPEEAIVRAVNDTTDNDTVGAIVGAAVGALHGESAIPRRWISGLSGRTEANDDGRMSELLDSARQAWAKAQ